MHPMYLSHHQQTPAPTPAPELKSDFGVRSDHASDSDSDSDGLAVQLVFTLASHATNLTAHAREDFIEVELIRSRC